MVLSMHFNKALDRTGHPNRMIPGRVYTTCIRSSGILPAGPGPHGVGVGVVQFCFTVANGTEHAPDINRCSLKRCFLRCSDIIVHSDVNEEDVQTIEKWLPGRRIHSPLRLAVHSPWPVTFCAWPWVPSGPSKRPPRSSEERARKTPLRPLTRATPQDHEISRIPWGLPLYSDRSCHLFFW